MRGDIAKKRRDIEAHRCHIAEDEGGLAGASNAVERRVFRRPVPENADECICEPWELFERHKVRLVRGQREETFERKVCAEGILST